MPGSELYIPIPIAIGTKFRNPKSPVTNTINVLSK